VVFEVVVTVVQLFLGHAMDCNRWQTSRHTAKWPRWHVVLPDN